MAALPQFEEEDIRVLDAALDELIARSEASLVIVVDEAGFIITSRGATEQFDITSIGALAAGVFAANQGIAGLVHESDFSSVYQQGQNFSLLVQNVDGSCRLVIVFPADISGGAVKYYAIDSAVQVKNQLQLARERAPGATLDLADMNLVNTADLFRKREPGGEPAGPVAAGNEPTVQMTYPGTYQWCSCGRSKTQPFCDGSHEGTGFHPIEVQVDSARRIAWCACKRSGTKPYCDGSHKHPPR